MKCTENILTLGIGKTRLILAIGVLFIALGISGTVEQTAFAEGPEPNASQDINSYLDQATKELVNEMNPTFQGFVAEAWEHLKQIAPPRDWEASIRDIIPQIHANAEDQGGILGAQSTNVTSSSCNFTYYIELGESGWAAAVTKSSCTMDFLRADVAVTNDGDIQSCFNCKSVFAYVNGLSCGYHVALGWHEWGHNPSGGGSSSDEGQAGC